MKILGIFFYIYNNFEIEILRNIFFMYQVKKIWLTKKMKNIILCSLDSGYVVMCKLSEKMFWKESIKIENKFKQEVTRESVVELYIK